MKQQGLFLIFLKSYLDYSRGHICFIKVKTKHFFLISMTMQDIFDVTCLNNKSS